MCKDPWMGIIHESRATKTFHLTYCQEHLIPPRATYPTLIPSCIYSVGMIDQLSRILEVVRPQPRKGETRGI